MDLDDDDDEVVAEYPLYAVSITDLNSQAADIRLAQLQYPLRPEWRGYGIENATEVTYKPVHRVLTATVPEDELSKVSCVAPCLQLVYSGHPEVQRALVVLVPSQKLFLL